MLALNPQATGRSCKPPRRLMASLASASSSSSSEVLAEEVLGVDVGANDAEIRRAFLSLARIYHPDKSSDPEAADKFRQLHDAYEDFNNHMAPARDV